MLLAPPKSNYHQIEAIFFFLPLHWINWVRLYTIYLASQPCIFSWHHQQSVWMSTWHQITSWLHSLVTIHGCLSTCTNGLLFPSIQIHSVAKKIVYSVQQVKVSVCKKIIVKSQCLQSKWRSDFRCVWTHQKQYRIDSYLAENNIVPIYQLRSKSFVIHIWSVFNASENPVMHSRTYFKLS